MSTSSSPPRWTAPTWWNPPSSLHLAFSEPFDPHDTELTLALVGGRSVAVRRAEVYGVDTTVVFDVAGPMLPGSYVVDVAAVGLDGHAVVGQFGLQVGDGPLIRPGEGCPGRVPGGGPVAVAVLGLRVLRSCARSRPAPTWW